MAAQVPAGGAPPRTAWPRAKGPEWSQVTEVEPGAGRSKPLLECIHCSHRFRGSAFRIRGHLLGTVGSGVAACTACPDDVRDRFPEAEESKRQSKLQAEKRLKLDECTART